MSFFRGRKVTVLVCVPHRFITQPPSPNVNQLDGFIFIRMNEKCFMKRKIFSVETGGEFWGHFLPVINDRRRLKRWPGENTCRLKWTAASPCRCVAEIFCQLFARPVKNEQRRRALHTPRWSGLPDDPATENKLSFFFSLTKRLNFDVFQRGMLAIFFFWLKRDPPGGSRLASTRTADTPTDSTPLGRISRLCPIRCVLQFVWNAFPAADWINEKLAHRWRWLQSNYFIFSDEFDLNWSWSKFKSFSFVFVEKFEKFSFEFWKKIAEIMRR